MSFFGSFSNFKIKDESPEETGKRAIRIFYDSSQLRSNLNFDEFLKKVNEANAQTIMTLGNAIEISEASASQVEDSMAKAGRVSAGLVPKSASQLIQAIQDRFYEFDLSDFVEVSSDIAEDLGAVAKEGAKIASIGLGSALLWQILGTTVALIGLFK
jgi:cysteinyl-tRNA synthetase